MDPSTGPTRTASSGRPTATHFGPRHRGGVPRPRADLRPRGIQAWWWERWYEECLNVVGAHDNVYVETGLWWRELYEKPLVDPNIAREAALGNRLGGGHADLLAARAHPAELPGATAQGGNRPLPGRPRGGPSTPRPGPGASSRRGAGADLHITSKDASGTRLVDSSMWGTHDTTRSSPTASVVVLCRLRRAEPAPPPSPGAPARSPTLTRRPTRGGRPAPTRTLPAADSRQPATVESSIQPSSPYSAAAFPHSTRRRSSSLS